MREDGRANLLELVESKSCDVTVVVHCVPLDPACRARPVAIGGCGAAKYVVETAPSETERTGSMYGKIEDASENNDPTSRRPTGSPNRYMQKRRGRIGFIERPARIWWARVITPSESVPHKSTA